VMGDWGLEIGPNPQSPIPNPQSPIPNPHYKIFFYDYIKKFFIIYFLFYFILIKNKYKYLIEKYTILLKSDAFLR